MTIFLSFLAFLLLLTVLILIHEWGHYYAAKRSGVVVEEFGFGFPPHATTIAKRGDTFFTLNWVPLGGFVRLKGENALDEKERTAKGSFGAASFPARIIILIAGVFMNFMLAIILLTVGFSVGHWIPTYLSLDDMEAAAEQGIIYAEMAVFIEDVISGGNAAKIGVPAESILWAVDGVPVTRTTEVMESQRNKTSVQYTVLSGEDFTEEQTFTVVLDDDKSGVVLSDFPRVLSAPKHPLLQAIGLSFRETKIMTQQTIYGFGHLMSSLARTGRVPEGITSIVGIAFITHASVQEGFMTYLRLVALLSLSLAILNILPFPALDGGRLLFVLAELVRRRPVNRRFELMVNAIGFIFLILLIVIITFNDIFRLFFS